MTASLAAADGMMSVAAVTAMTTVVDYNCRMCELAPALIAGDHERHFRQCDHRRQTIYIALRGPSATEPPQELIECTRTISHDLAPDSGSRRPLEVRSQCLTAVPTHIVRVIPRKEQHPSTKPIPRNDAQRARAEVGA